MGRTGPDETWSYPDRAAGRPGAKPVIEIAHLLYETGIDVADPLDDGARDESDVAVHGVTGTRRVARLDQRGPERSPAVGVSHAAIGQLARLWMTRRPRDDDRLFAMLAQLSCRLEEHRQGPVAEDGVVVHPQVVVVVTRDGGREGPPHPPVPVELAVTVQHGDLRKLLGDRLAG